jgi:hypothetical protein
MLLPLLSATKESLRHMPSVDGQFLRDIDKSIQLIAGLQKRRERVIEMLPIDLDRIEKLVDRAANSQDQPRERVPELIKRITLGLIISSFFIAILRYSAQLFVTHQEQVIAAERDDLAVRQFYVALRSAQENPEERAIVLQEFLRQSKLTAGAPTSTTILESSSENTALLRDIIQALLKKI